MSRLHPAVSVRGSLISVVAEVAPPLSMSSVTCQSPCVLDEAFMSLERTLVGDALDEAIEGVSAWFLVV